MATIISHPFHKSCKMLQHIMFKGKEKCQFTSFATTFVFFTKYCLHYKPTHHISLLKNMEQQAIQGINITQ
jgi:hypothetical protein